jgi:hypothetical protein
MQHQNESKVQCWRAVAVAVDGTEHLVYLGRSTSQVRSGYESAYLEILDEDERAQIRQISLQRWNGAPDEGRWMHQGTLPIPGAVKVPERTLANTA